MIGSERGHKSDLSDRGKSLKRILIVGGTSAEQSVYQSWLEQPDLSWSHLDIETCDAADLVLAHASGDALVILDASDAKKVGSTNDWLRASNSALIIWPNASEDGLSKPLTRSRFLSALKNKVDVLDESLSKNDPAASTLPVYLTGTSSAIFEYRALAEKAASSKAPVFLIGEAGTGRPQAARAIHDLSPRKTGPFIEISCASFSGPAADVELFGEEQSIEAGGERRTGLIELADKGTLVFHDISELDQSMQIRLLSIIKAGTFSRRGSARLRRVDVRFISTMPDDPFDALASGKLRADLFYALHVLPLRLPALRDRRNDIEEMAKALLQAVEGRTCTLSAEAVSALTRHSWPGNVRELDSLITQVATYSGSGEITGATVQKYIHTLPVSRKQAQPPSLDDDVQPYWIQEQRIIEHAIAACGGHISKAAEALEISASTIYRKMQVWQERDIDPATTATPDHAVHRQQLN
ncbi:MAG: sigma 54-interacting transcriptional regulator [Pseudomonadota bacterium]